MANDELTRNTVPELIEQVRLRLKEERGEPAEGCTADDIFPARLQLKHACDETDPFLEPYDPVEHARYGLLILRSIFNLQAIEPSFMQGSRLILGSYCLRLASGLKSE